ncbi:hypothetical protein F751_5481 [Auxenochlorella protothecoides]|uniref:Uncharacterized protein n=1 Tax=Auxenochlorella protothecoides TaxID=3075 RepID=A0A087STS1_AUXPR|nr:hypothetical protein F751_5481 [Auxenochlorella protothecoides]KFM29125.1 hypothetical protein F751_5481 [Auxenochlorella protothecoides]
MGRQRHDAQLLHAVIRVSIRGRPPQLQGGALHHHQVLCLLSSCSRLCAAGLCCVRRPLPSRLTRRVWRGRERPLAPRPLRLLTRTVLHRRQEHSQQRGQPLSLHGGPAGGVPQPAPGQRAVVGLLVAVQVHHHVRLGRGGAGGEQVTLRPGQGRQYHAHLAAEDGRPQARGGPGPGCAPADMAVDVQAHGLAGLGGAWARHRMQVPAVRQPLCQHLVTQEPGVKPGELPLVVTGTCPRVWEG